MFAVATYPDAPHTRAVCSFEAGGGVFDDNASLGRCADPRSRSQIHFGIRLPLVNVIGRDDSLKIAGRRKSFKDRFDILPRGCRSNGLEPATLVESRKPGSDAR